MKEVTFSLKEFCEVKALQTIMELCFSIGLKIRWKLLNFSVNTDFKFCSIEEAFRGYENVSVISHDDPDCLHSMKIYGFKTDMTHQLDAYVHKSISCAEIAACRLNKGRAVVANREMKNIVVGNMKVKCPVEDFQMEIFDRLAHLPYQTVVVPRHPLTDMEMASIKLPECIKFRNTMGDLEDLQAHAHLTIMGRVFSAGGLEPDDDHNPLEATISSNTMCGIIKEIPDAYRWLYEESGLIHQCQDYDEIFSQIQELIFDRDLPKKLEARQRWVLGNRAKYLKKIREIMEI